MADRSDPDTVLRCACALPLSDVVLDDALIATLGPGAYTAQVSGVGGGTGVALIEIYEVP